MVESFFVYGTLALGRPNEHVLKNIGGTWQTATLKGALREEGWGAEMGYPGIELSDDGEAIQGFIFTSENLKEHWEKLDAFEGEAYRRVLAKAKLANGCIVDAYVYSLS